MVFQQVKLVERLIFRLFPFHALEHPLVDLLSLLRKLPGAWLAELFRPEAFRSFPEPVQDARMEEAEQLGEVQAEKIQHPLGGHLLKPSSSEPLPSVVLLQNSEDVFDLDASVHPDFDPLR